MKPYYILMETAFHGMHGFISWYFSKLINLGTVYLVRCILMAQWVQLMFDTMLVSVAHMVGNVCWFLFCNIICLIMIANMAEK